jgi:hypothetical protein
MKNKITLLVLSLIISVTFSNCKKEDRVSPNNTSSVISQGDWKVSSFNDSGKDETSHFAGYSFRFDDKGQLIATKSGSSVSGTWSTGKDDSHTELIINFPSAPLNELNEDWHVLSQSSSSMELEHVSGGNGGTDKLTLQKN